MAGNDRNLLGGEAGTHQAAGLHFLVGEDGAEALHQAGVEVVEQAVDDGVQVTPYDKLFGWGFVVSYFGKLTEQGLVLCRGRVCHEADDTELLQ